MPRLIKLTALGSHTPSNTIYTVEEVWSWRNARGEQQNFTLMVIEVV
jgi:hypothetical protein